jgi:hypothetical protein
VTHRISFQRAPADVTLGEAMTIAGQYWRATIERWLLAAIAVALVEGLVSWLFFDSLLDGNVLNDLTAKAARGEALDPSVLPSLVAGPIAVAAVTLVAGWFLTANAVAGLRGTEVTLGWVVPAGLRSLLASLIVALAAALTLTTSLLLGPLGILAILALMPVAIYLLIRIGFWELSIFDGATVPAGLDRTWRLTRGAVLRYVGWSLALLAIGVGLFLVSLVVTATVGPFSRPVASAINGGLNLALSAYSTIVLAVLYESQRARRLPVPRPEPAARSPLDPPPPPPGW